LRADGIDSGDDKFLQALLPRDDDVCSSDGEIGEALVLADPREKFCPEVGDVDCDIGEFLPVDGAFYLYADVSHFADDSFDFAKRMLEEAGVAVTPGIDFDPERGKRFIRFSYARSAADMREAVERIGAWLSKL